MDVTAFWDFWNVLDKLDALRGDVVALGLGKGGGVHFDVLPPSGSCGGAVERMLRRYGIGMWGKRVTRDSNDELMAPWWIAFNVRRSQAVWARYLLQRYGCHMLGPQDVAARRATGMPVAWADGRRGPGAAAAVPAGSRELVDRLDLP